MGAAQGHCVNDSWRGVARTIARAAVMFLSIATMLAIAPGARAQSRAGDAAGALARPWQSGAAVTSETVRRSDAVRTTTTRSDARDVDALGRPDQAPPSPPPVTFDLALATHVPISLGIEANLVMPLGFLLRAHVGFMPEPYIGIINGVAQTFEAYDDYVASAISRSGANSFVLRLSGGIRPVPGYGFEILGGYTMIRGGGRITAQDFEAATGQSMDYPGLESIGISGVLHAFHVEIGWSALVWDHLVIRASLGWMHTLDAEASVDVPADLRARAGGRIEETEADIRRGMTTWGFSPEARVGVGYQF